MRYWLPLLLAMVCLFGATKAHALVGLVLIVVAFALVIEVSTKLFAQAGRGGRLTDHRQ